MPGAIAANAYQGARSEYLALYVFSQFGTAVQLARESDFGLDLTCTLTERDGQRARPYAYYSVQVKSDDAPWEFDSPSAVKWLLTYPAPILFCVVDKSKARFRVYHMTQRFHSAIRTDLPDELAVAPGRRDDGRVPISWGSDRTLYLGDPILDFHVDELVHPKTCENVRQVLEHWITNDLRNVVRQQIGMRVSAGPASYETNKVPGSASDDRELPEGARLPASSATFGAFRITALPGDLIEKAKLTAAEHLEWLGRVLLQSGDRRGALLAGLTVRHLIPADALPGDLGFNPNSLYSDLRTADLPTGATAAASLSGVLDALLKELEGRV
jgi:hypothetical protein